MLWPASLSRLIIILVFENYGYAEPRPCTSTARTVITRSRLSSTTSLRKLYVRHADRAFRWTQGVPRPIYPTTLLADSVSSNFWNCSASADTELSTRHAIPNWTEQLR